MAALKRPQVSEPKQKAWRPELVGHSCQNSWWYILSLPCISSCIWGSSSWPPLDLFALASFLEGMWTLILWVRKDDLRSGPQATTLACLWLPSQRKRPFVTSSSQTCCQDTYSSDGLFPLAPVHLLPSWSRLIHISITSMSYPAVISQSLWKSGHRQSQKIQSLGDNLFYPWLHSRAPTLTGARESSQMPQPVRRYTEARRAPTTISRQAMSCHCVGVRHPSSLPDWPFVQLQMGGFASSFLSQRNPQ